MGIEINAPHFRVKRPKVKRGTNSFFYRYDGQDLANGMVEFDIQLHDGQDGVEGRVLDVFLVARDANGGGKRKPLTCRGWHDWWFGRQRIVTGINGEASFKLKFPRKPTKYYYLIMVGDLSIRIDFISDTSGRNGETQVLDSVRLEDWAEPSPPPERADVDGPLALPTPHPRRPHDAEEAHSSVFRLEGGRPEAIDLPDLPKDVQLAKEASAKASKLLRKVARDPTPQPLGPAEFRAQQELMGATIVSQNQTIARLIKLLDQASIMLRAGGAYQKGYHRAEHELREMLARYVASYREFDESARQVLEDARRVMSLRVSEVDSSMESIRNIVSGFKVTARLERKDMAADHRRYTEEAADLIREGRLPNVRGDEYSSLRRSTRRLGAVAAIGLVAMALAIAVLIII